MSWKDVFKKIGQIALAEAPMALQIAGLPASLAPAIVGGVLAAQAAKGKSNSEKAQIAGEIAKTVIEQTNKVLIAKGHPALFDEMYTDDAINNAVKLTYDLTKAKVQVLGQTMPVPTSPTDTPPASSPTA